MKNDAKLGLIMGVVAVLTIAVVYHYKPIAAKPVVAPKGSATPSAPLASVSIPSKPTPPANNNPNADLD